MVRSLICMICLIMITGSYIPEARAQSGAAAGFSSVFNMFFGTKSERQSVEGCDAQSASGFLGMVNNNFCHLEKDMGLSGPGKATKQFGNMSVRAEIENNSTYTYTDPENQEHSYGNRAQVWVCSSGCDSASNFSQAMYIIWDYSGSGTINKGYMIMDPCAFSAGGTGNCAIELRYNVGSDTADKVLIGKMLFSVSEGTFKMYADGRESSNVKDVAMLMVNGSSAGPSNSHRFLARLDEANNNGAVYFELENPSGEGVGSANLDASGDSPPDYACFSRSENSTDYDYSITGTSGCSISSFPNVSLRTVGAYTYIDITGDWNGMSANPSSL